MVDQNYLYLRSIMEMPQNTNLMTVSSNLTEGTKDDRKRRMMDVEGRSQGYTLRIGIQSNITVLM